MAHPLLQRDLTKGSPAFAGGSLPAEALGKPRVALGKLGIQSQVMSWLNMQTTITTLRSLSRRYKSVKCVQKRGCLCTESSLFCDNDRAGEESEVVSVILVFWILDYQAVPPHPVEPLFLKFYNLSNSLPVLILKGKEKKAAQAETPFPQTHKGQRQKNFKRI